MFAGTLQFFLLLSCWALLVVSERTSAPARSIQSTFINGGMALIAADFSHRYQQIDVPSSQFR
jgi:hypothetical protein